MTVVLKPQTRQRRSTPLFDVHYEAPAASALRTEPADQQPQRPTHSRARQWVLMLAATLTMIGSAATAYWAYDTLF